jgi:hypothetical protein
MTNVKSFIISPHPDDELIACYSILNWSKNNFIDLTCVYLFGNEERQIEAVNCSNKFKFNVIFCNNIQSVINSIQNSIVFIPSISDINIEHKWVNKYFFTKLSKSNTLISYSYQNLFDERNNLFSIDINLKSKVNAIKNIYKSQYIDLESKGILNQLTKYEEFRIE